MKKILLIIYNFFKGFSARDWFLLGLFLVTFIALIQTHFSNKTKIIALTEQADSFRNKANEEYKANLALIQTEKELKKTNDSLYNEYKKIKDSDPLVVTKTKIVAKIDTLEMQNYVEKIITLNDSIRDTIYINRNQIIYPANYAINWNYNEQQDANNYFKINGQTITDSLFTNTRTYLKKMELGADVILDLVSSGADNAFKIIARSNNPRVTITDVQGSVINPTENETIKKLFPTKHWGLGASLGYGVAYGQNNKKFSYGPQLTIGVNYNILTW